MLDTRDDEASQTLRENHPDRISQLWQMAGSTFVIRTIDTDADQVALALQTWVDAILSTHTASHEVKVPIMAKGNGTIMAALHALLTLDEDIEPLLDQLSQWNTRQGYSIEYISVGARPAFLFEEPASS